MEYEPIYFNFKDKVLKATFDDYGILDSVFIPISKKPGWKAVTAKHPASKFAMTYFNQHK